MRLGLSIQHNFQVTFYQDSTQYQHFAQVCQSRYRYCTLLNVCVRIFYFKIRASIHLRGLWIHSVTLKTSFVLTIQICLCRHFFKLSLQMLFCKNIISVGKGDFEYFKWHSILLLYCTNFTHLSCLTPHTAPVAIQTLCAVLSTIAWGWASGQIQDCICKSKISDN